MGLFFGEFVLLVFVAGVSGEVNCLVLEVNGAVVELDLAVSVIVSILFKNLDAHLYLSWLIMCFVGGGLCVA